MRENILPGAGPFYFEGNKIGIMMLHGFGGGTCADLKYIAKDIFNQKGYSIYIPLLPGFGTHPEQLHKVKVKDWLESLEKEFKFIQDKCDVIIVGGHSIGGVLPFIIAKSHEINGIFAISAPIGIRGIGPLIAPLLNIFVKYHAIESDQFKRDTNGKWVGYDKIPINIVGKVKELIKQMREILPEIQSPVLLLQGRKDRQIKKKSIDYIYYRVKSLNKKKIWLENNDHPILDSPDHNIIVSEIIKFIEGIIKKD